MSAERVIEPLVGAFAEQIKIVVAQDRRKAVGVFKIDDLLAEPGAQLVARGSVRKRACKQPGFVEQRKPRHIAMIADRLDL